MFPFASAVWKTGRQNPLVVEIVREAYITGSFRTQPVAIVFRKR
jgi:hypothetical protein